MVLIALNTHCFDSLKSRSITACNTFSFATKFFDVPLIPRGFVTAFYFCWIRLPLCFFIYPHWHFRFLFNLMVLVSHTLRSHMFSVIVLSLSKLFVSFCRQAQYLSPDIAGLFNKGHHVLKVISISS